MKPESKSKLKTKPISPVNNKPTSKKDPKDPNKKLLFMTLGAIVSLLAIGSIVVVVLSSIKVDLTNQFYGALEKSMSLSYVHQKYTTAGSNYGSNMHMVADSYTDFSNVKAPKTKAHMTVDFADINVLDVDYVATKNYADYVKINKLGDGKEVKTLQFDKNTWYAMKDASEASNVDMFQTAKTINQTFGQSISGNYTADDRNALLKMYKEKKGFVFDVKKDVKEVTVHGERAYVYSVKINAVAIKAINDEAAKRLGLKTTLHEYKNQAMTIAISAKTGKFVQIIVKESGLTSTLDIDYPETLEITVPKETIPYSSLSMTESQAHSNSY